MEARAKPFDMFAAVDRRTLHYRPARFTARPKSVSTNKLDIFLFSDPATRNEAEPLVIYEAMRRGVHVIALRSRARSPRCLRDGRRVGFFPREGAGRAAGGRISSISATIGAPLFGRQNASRCSKLDEFFLPAKTSLEKLSGLPCGARPKTVSIHSENTHKKNRPVAAAMTTLTSGCPWAAAIEYRDPLEYCPHPSLKKRRAVERTDTLTP